jgi:hydrogenase expression/formation protein HypE
VPTRHSPRCAPIPWAASAAAIGVVKADPPTLVLLKTEFGGTRIVDMLIGDPLPRIC